jgi:hypothetical protein
MTHTYCSECKRHIPWGQPRVFMRFMEGSKVTKEGEVCVRWCIEGAEGEALISAGMRAAALKMHSRHPGMAKKWGGQRRDNLH